ncbi:MAG: DUF4038 domain-containing protein [Myxococcaceae bacterium]
MGRLLSRLLLALPLAACPPSGPSGGPPLPALRTLALSPKNAVLEVGESLQLEALADYSDGSRRDVTRAARYTVATDAGLILEDGSRAVGHSVGPAAVEATFQGASARTVVDVVQLQGSASRPRAGPLAAPAEASLPPAVRPEVAFPLSVSPNGRFLIDAHGVPFRLQGEGAWSLIANLTADEADSYLVDRQHKGFDALLVNLLEHRFAAQAPRNRAGQAPFRTAGDFSTPEEAYFQSAAAFVQKARAHGFLVLLAPAYLGYGCPSQHSAENEGWSAEMGRQSTSACLAYGQYVGSRFRSFDNLVWVQGGDCLPEAGSPLEACAQKVFEGLRQAGATQLQTGHFSPNSTSLDEAAFAKDMQLDAVYQYRTPQAACRKATAQLPPWPTFLVESGYENESIQGSVPPSRKYLWWAALSCTAGVFSGSKPVWAFEEGWEKALDSPGALDVSRMAGLLDSLPWQNLIPSGLLGMRPLVTAGGGAPGAQDEVVAAATEDGQWLLAYVPPGTGRGHRSFVLDVRALAGEATARWYNPWTGAFLSAGQVPNQTPWWFTTPGDNGSGYDDWVLVLSRPPQSAPAAIGTP